MTDDRDAIARLRHELRTPLNHVIGYSEMLAEEFGAERPELLPALHRLHALGHEVLGLVNESLGAAGADAGRIVALEASAGPLVDEIVDVGQTARKRAEAIGAQRVADDLERIVGSAGGLRTMLGNGLAVTGARPESTSRASEGSAGPTTTPRADAARILVVDDDTANRDVLERRLARDGHRVTTAADGHEALATTARERFDLVLLDVMMPGLDGVEVLRRLKADETLRHLPVLMISALGDMDHVVRCIELGAEDYLPKPFDPVLLRARINASLEKKRLLDQERRHLTALADWNRTLETRVAEKIRELEKLGQLTQLVAPQVAQAILAGGADDPLKPHRREIVVVLVDIRGFASFMETAEPEELMGVLREYQAEMGRLVAAHEGTLLHYSGDGLVVIFNDPVEVADPAERAVRMAVAMRDRFGTLATEWRRRGWEMTLGIGIAQGFATIGAIGFEGRWQYGAMGRVVGTAGALCGAAKTSQIFVTTKVAGAVEGFAKMQQIEDLQVRGLARPLAVFSVLGIEQ